MEQPLHFANLKKAVPIIFIEKHQPWYDMHDCTKRYRFCWAMIKIREEIEDIAQGRVTLEDR